jgi:hypothetical protein
MSCTRALASITDTGGQELHHELRAIPVHDQARQLVGLAEYQPQRVGADRQRRTPGHGGLDAPGQQGCGGGHASPSVQQRDRIDDAGL